MTAKPTTHGKEGKNILNIINHKTQNLRFDYELVKSGTGRSDIPFR